jgi:hypothetical protein
MSSKSDDRTRPGEPAAEDDGARIERRRQQRDMASSPNWETIVLQRMAGRVKSLSHEPPPGAITDRDGGWEAAALLALKRRMRDLPSK